MEKFSKAEQKIIEDIDVVNSVVIDSCVDAVRVCDPENFFEMIEQCKICGRYI